MNKRVFISYRQAVSKALAREIETTLKHKYQFDVFRDETELRDAGPFDVSLRHRIDSSDVIICLLAEGTLTSEWVKMEIEHAHSRRIPMIPVFHRGYQPSQGPQSAAIEELLLSNGIEIDDVMNRHVDSSINELAEIIHNAQRRIIQQTQLVQPPRVLIVEDDASWQRLIVRSLERMPCPFEIEIAETYDDALDRVERNKYDLITIDLRLRRGTSSERGMDLALRIRDLPHNSTCGLVIITAAGDEKKRHDILAQYRADDFIPKGSFKAGIPFDEVIQRVLLIVRQRHASNDYRNRYGVRLIFDNHHQLNSAVTLGRDEQDTIEHVQLKPVIGIDAITERTAELIGTASTDEAGKKAAVRLGQDIYNSFLTDGAGQLALQRAQLKSKASDIIVEIEGSIELLRAPFELVTIANPLHRLTITRRLRQQPVRNALPLRETIYELMREQLSLSFLIVGEQEPARALEVQVRSELTCLGIPSRITVLDGAEHATHERFRDEIRGQKGYHFVHFVGWKTHRSLPCLYDSFGALTPMHLDRVASDLQRHPLKCIFIDQPVIDPDELMHTFGTLSQTGTATMIGYRWQPDSAYTQTFTTMFYTQIWREFSIYNAFIEARKKAEDTAPKSDWKLPIFVANSLV